jgi:aminoglycoside phosphotransferase (APT) family kinase protein
LIGGRGATVDTAALDAWLASRLPGWRGPSSARVINGGNSNPVVRVDAADGRAYALRSRAPGVDPRAHGIERE